MEIIEAILNKLDVIEKDVKALKEKCQKLEHSALKESDESRIAAIWDWITLHGEKTEFETVKHLNAHARMRESIGNCELKIASLLLSTQKSVDNDGSTRGNNSATG